ncbi:MAG: putative rane protein [Herbinix sp.]|nr:putative rane protein [Herbinix sp.]
MASIYWLVILAALLLIEIFTLGLFTIWFSGGALIAFFVSLVAEDNLLLQIIVFLTVSLVLLIFTRPLVLKYYNPKRIKTNYEGVIGKNGIVIVTIDNLKSTGQVTVDGQEWSAKTADGSRIEKGSIVNVQAITGVRLVVTKAAQETRTVSEKISNE